MNTIQTTAIHRMHVALAQAWPALCAAVGLCPGNVDRSVDALPDVLATAQGPDDLTVALCVSPHGRTALMAYAEVQRDGEDLYSARPTRVQAPADLRPLLRELRQGMDALQAEAVAAAEAAQWAHPFDPTDADEAAAYAAHQREVRRAQD